MTSDRDLFERWVHPASPWSLWAKPTLFDRSILHVERDLPLLPDFAWDNNLGQDCAVVVDLPAELSVLTGLAMAREGFRPIPLFNGCPGEMGGAALDTAKMQRALYAGAAQHVLRDVPPAAPPVFLLDSRRKTPGTVLRPGMLDNRWVCFAQDFPSAGYLREHGIIKVIVIRLDGSLPLDDLQHILRRWQNAGMQIYLQVLEQREGPRPITIPRASFFRDLFFHLIVRLGLRPNWAGGFGAVIPQPSQG